MASTTINNIKIDQQNLIISYTTSNPPIKDKYKCINNICTKSTDQDATDKSICEQNCNKPSSKNRYILYNMTADEVSGKNCDDTTTYCLPSQLWNNPQEYCNTMVLCFLDPNKFADGSYINLPEAFEKSIEQMNSKNVDVLISCGGQAANGKWDNFLNSPSTTGDNIWAVMEKYNVGFDFDLEEYGTENDNYKELIKYVVNKRNASGKNLYISIDVAGTPCTGGDTGACNIIGDVIGDIDWINVMVTAPNQASSLKYWIDGRGSSGKVFKTGIGKENINKVVLAYFASYSNGPVLNCASGSACPTKSDCLCNCASNSTTSCFYQASGIQLVKLENILGISFWNTQTGSTGGSYTGCTSIDPVGFKEGYEYLINDKLPSGCEPAKSCPNCDDPSQTCCGKLKCTKCCQASQCADLTKSQCDTGWTWCGD